MSANCLAGKEKHRDSGGNRQPEGRSGQNHHRDQHWIEDASLDDGELCAEVAEDAAYAPYLVRQESELKDLRAAEALPLPEDFPYAEIPGLSREMVERLSKARPGNLAAAGRVPGITPAALAALLVHARRRAA